MPAIPPALLAAFGGGVAAAVMYLTILTGTAGGMVMVYLAPLPLLVVGLAFGPMAAMISTGVAALLMAGMAGSLVLSGTFVITAALPTILVVRQAMLCRQRPDGTAEWYPPGLLLVLLAGLGVTAIAIAFGLALVFGDGSGLETLIRTLVVTPLVESLQASDSTVGIGQDGDPGAFIALIFPGVAAVSWLMMVVINGLLAQAALARFERLPRPGLRMSMVELPAWTALALALAVVGAIGTDGQLRFLLVNVTIVAMLPFLFSGLAVVHTLATRLAFRGAVLIAFYILLAIMAWPLLAIVGLGIIEQWAGLRRRFAACGPDRGDV